MLPVDVIKNTSCQSTMASSVSMQPGAVDSLLNTQVQKVTTLLEVLALKGPYCTECPWWLAFALVLNLCRRRHLVEEHKCTISHRPIDYHQRGSLALLIGSGLGIITLATLWFSQPWGVTFCISLLIMDDFWVVWWSFHSIYGQINAKLLRHLFLRFINQQHTP